MRNRILQLLSDNRTTPRCFRVEASTADEATIYLYDVIIPDDDDYWGGVSALKFVNALNSLSAATIHLRINSPGGDVFAARAIETAIRQHASRTVAHVDGFAASAASYVMLAADEVEISDGAFIMIHKAMTVAVGNADDLRHVTGLLDDVDAAMIRTYADETGQSQADIEAWVAAETWFNAQEAVERGFADRVVAVPGGAGANAQAGMWNLAAYAHAPAIPRAPVAPMAPAPESSAARLPGPDVAAMQRRFVLHHRL